MREAGARVSGPAAAIEVEALLRHVTGLSRAGLYSRLDQIIDTAAAEEYFDLIERLKNGEPLQYLTGHIEFYGLDFTVSPDVLIPRPETELMVERALDIAKGYSSPVIADIGCGSGAVAVTLSKHLPGSTVIAVDISSGVLDLTRRNAAFHGCSNIEFVESDLLESLGDRRIDIICANLPYVPAVEAQGNRFEPQLALDGGPDGLDIIRRLVSQVAGRPNKPGWLLLEFGTGQTTAVQTIIDKYLPGSRTVIHRDLIPLDRLSVTELI
ncbi:peptide chain release factor N(5)-glutamine methyltransferase [Dehalogenimonas sp. THU2]|uniref:peptide chain release factor N(5)-glutamine methyltransferase n=1 Tax=Dehalogenimonas sp. THU2 TaxID=3151121 RepID=UPI0032185A3B